MKILKNFIMLILCVGLGSFLYIIDLLKHNEK